VLAVSNVLSAYLCDPSAARRFIGFTAFITAEARKTDSFVQSNVDPVASCGNECSRRCA
jgi:hypothetical protein